MKRKQFLKKHRLTLSKMYRGMSGVSIAWLLVFGYYMVTQVTFDSKESILLISVLVLPGWLAAVLFTLWEEGQQLAEEEHFLSATLDTSYDQDHGVFIE